MSTIETCTMPVISTIHMPGTNAIADLMAMDLPAANWMYGGFVLVTQEIDASEATAWLRPISEWAIRNGFDWVRFDCDGEQVVGLPKFESAWS